MDRFDTPLRGTGILSRAPGGYEGTVTYYGISHRCFVAREPALDGVDRISVEIRDAAHDELPPEALRPAFENVRVPDAPGVALSPRRRSPRIATCAWLPAPLRPRKHPVPARRGRMR